MQRGFTVVEALVAATLLTAAVVSLVQLLAMSAQGALASRTATAALMAAEQKMEELRAVSWAAVAASPAGTDYLDESAQQVCRSVPPAPCPDAASVRQWTAVAASFTPRWFPSTVGL